MFIDQTHSQFLLNGLSLLRQDEELCDIEIWAGETKVYGHKVVLAAISDYFKAMFTGKLEESIVKKIYLHEVDGKSVVHLVDFAYSGHISININNVELLLMAANMLQVSKVVTACCDFLIKQLHPSNCLGFLEFADKLSLKSLRDSCMDYAAKYFVELPKYEEFQYSNVHVIKLIISYGSINITYEDDVFDFVEKWILFDKTKRIVYFKELFGKIRLCLLSTLALSEILTSNLLAMADSDGYIRLKIQYMLNMKRNPCRLLDEDFKKYSLVCRRNNNHIIVFCGKDSYTNPLCTVSKFDVQKSIWESCQMYQQPRSSASAACINNCIFLTGGIGPVGDGNELIHMSSVACYSVKTNEWFSVSSMHCKRSSHATVSYGNRIFAIGGYDGKTSLKSAECYDANTDTWSSISSMNYSRSSFAAVSLDRFIYVLGGHNTCTVERYDTRAAQWELMPAMSTKRINFGAAQVCGFIYVVGGHDGREYLRSMERFDPNTSEWTVMRPMPSARSGIGVTVVGHHIYVVGGHDGNRYLNTACRYDVFEDSWSSLPEMLTARCYMAVAPAYVPIS